MPGHQAYLDFAIEVGAELPSRARETAAGRAAGEHAPTGSGCLVRTSPGGSPGIGPWSTRPALADLALVRINQNTGIQYP